MIIIRPCDYCNIEYEAESRYLNRNQGQFCSQRCSGRYFGELRKKENKEPNAICAYCDKPFYKRESSKKKSKSGLFFCSREHKDAAQRIGGIREIMPPHYGTTQKNYRKIAFDAVSNPKCIKCGFSEILMVHHKDEDRTNNSIENLEILCPNCHYLIHWGPTIISR